MTIRVANRLAARIERDDPRCRVEWLRTFGRGTVEIDVVDTRTGTPFVVRSPEDWAERRSDALYSGAHYDDAQAVA